MSISRTVHPSAKPDGGVTTAPPFDRPAITALVQVDDEPMPRQLDGRALGWTSDAVLVDIGIDGQRYQVWIAADHVTRRA